jgi:hypothetical protein
MSGEVTTLEQPVAIDGYFFKRCAYASEQGVSIAPLVVTAEPRWYPEPNAAAVGLSAPELAVAIGGGLVLGLIGLASSFYFLRSAARHREPQPDESAIAQQLRDLEALQQRGS